MNKKHLIKIVTKDNDSTNTINKDVLEENRLRKILGPFRNILLKIIKEDLIKEESEHIKYIVNAFITEIDREIRNKEKNMIESYRFKYSLFLDIVSEIITYFYINIKESLLSFDDENYTNFEIETERYKFTFIVKQNDTYRKKITLISYIDKIDNITKCESSLNISFLFIINTNYNKVKISCCVIGKYLNESISIKIRDLRNNNNS